MPSFRFVRCRHRVYRRRQFFAIYIGKVIFAWLLLMLLLLLLLLLHAFYICEHVYSLKTCQFNIFLCMIIITTFPCFASHSNDVRCVLSYSLPSFGARALFVQSIVLFDCCTWALIFVLHTERLFGMQDSTGNSVLLHANKIFFSCLFTPFACYLSIELLHLADADLFLHTKPQRDYTIFQFHCVHRCLCAYRCNSVSVLIESCFKWLESQCIIRAARQQIKGKTISCMQRCCNKRRRQRIAQLLKHEQTKTSPWFFFAECKRSFAKEQRQKSNGMNRIGEERERKRRSKTTKRQEWKSWCWKGAASHTHKATSTTERAIQSHTEWSRTKANVLGPKRKERYRHCNNWF